MSTNQVQAIEEVFGTCKLCENSGIKYTPNDEEDFDAAYCECFRGEQARKAGVGQYVGV